MDGEVTRGPYVQTVLGRVHPDLIGHTLPHEHVLVDVSRGAQNARDMIGEGEEAVAALTPENGSLKRFGFVDIPATRGGLWQAEVGLQNRLDAELNPVFYGHFRLLDTDDASDAVRDFHDEGGSCIVDCTAIGMGRSPEGLKMVSRRTGVHIVMSTGFYLSPFHPPRLHVAAEGEIVELLVEELRVGVYPGGPVPGMIKAAVTSLENPNELKSLRAGLRASSQTGAPLTVHPGGRDSVFAIADLIETMGADPARVILGHSDSRLFTVVDMLRLAAFGCYIAFDNFGRETSMRQRGNQDLPNDAGRLNLIRALIDAGYAEQVLMSHDIALKWQLRKGGGLGYGHIVSNVAQLMRYKEFDEVTIDLLTHINPVRAVTREG